jgi:hypothetical protein
VNVVRRPAQSVAASVNAKSAGGDAPASSIGQKAMRRATCAP